MAVIGTFPLGVQFRIMPFQILSTFGDSSTPVILPHNDNEDCIEPDSLIYTVSVGAKRMFRFTNQSEPINEQELSVDHGSV